MPVDVHLPENDYANQAWPSVRSPNTHRGSKRIEISLEGLATIVEQADASPSCDSLAVSRQPPEWLHSLAIPLQGQSRCPSGKSYTKPIHQASRALPTAPLYGLCRHNRDRQSRA